MIAWKTIHIENTSEDQMKKKIFTNETYNTQKL